MELSVPVSVELTTSLLASTVTLSSPLAGDIPTVPTPRIWKPRPFTPSPRPSPLVSPLLPKTLTGMGAEYVSDLNHMNTLRELPRRLPLFLRGRWTECAGRIIGLGKRPKFQDFVTFVKERAKLVDNEFGRDMVPGSLKETPSRRNRVNQSRNLPE